jgi:NADH-quinone oxidoreductase subunit N
MITFNDSILFQFNQFLVKDFTIGVIIGLSFIFSGLFFKVGFFPYFIWIPDVYSGVNIIITALYSTLPKLVTLILILKLYFFSFSDYIFFFSWIISFSILLGLTFGSLGALYQVSLKRLWGFSAVVHICYIMTNLLSLSALNFYCVLFYIFIYIIIALNFFLILFVLRFRRRRYVNHLNDLRILSKTNLLLSMLIAFTMFSLAGIPPLAGFFSKLMVFLTLCNSGDFFIAMVIIMFSVISGIYYLRIVRKLFFKTYNYFMLSELFSDLSFYVICLISLLNILHLFYLKFIINIFNIIVEVYLLNRFDNYLLFV